MPKPAIIILPPEILNLAECIEKIELFKKTRDKNALWLAIRELQALSQDRGAEQLPKVFFYLAVAYFLDKPKHKMAQSRARYCLQQADAYLVSTEGNEAAAQYPDLLNLITPVPDVLPEVSSANGDFEMKPIIQRNTGSRRPIARLTNQGSGLEIIEDAESIQQTVDSALDYAANKKLSLRDLVTIARWALNDLQQHRYYNDRKLKTTEFKPFIDQMIIDVDRLLLIYGKLLSNHEPKVSVLKNSILETTLDMLAYIADRKDKILALDLSDLQRECLMEFFHFLAILQFEKHAQKSLIKKCFRLAKAFAPAKEVLSTEIAKKACAEIENYHDMVKGQKVKTIHSQVFLMLHYADLEPVTGLNYCEQLIEQLERQEHNKDSYRNRAINKLIQVLRAHVPTDDELEWSPDQQRVCKLMVRALQLRQSYQGDFYDLVDVTKARIEALEKLVGVECRPKPSEPLPDFTM